MTDKEVMQPATEGWVMAPRHPTPEMISAGRNAPMCATAAHTIIEDYIELYKAMLAAAPAIAQPVQPADAVAPITDAGDQALGLYAVQEMELQDLFKKHRPDMDGHLLSRVAQLLTAPAQPNIAQPALVTLISEGDITRPEQPAPPECETEGEKRAYAFGWFKALEQARNEKTAQPAAYMNADGDLFSVESHEKFGYGSTPLYVSPPIAQPVQPAAQPVGYRSLQPSGSYTYCNTPQFFDNAEPVYTHPAAIVLPVQSATTDADELRRAVQYFTTALNEGEWAEWVSTDPDARELESAITDMHNEIREARDALDCVNANGAQSVQPAAERNFCERCGKRLGDSEHIHTCTPPTQAAQPVQPDLASLLLMQEDHLLAARIAEGHKPTSSPPLTMPLAGLLYAKLTQPVQPDTARLDWLAMYGSFGVDSSSGQPGGNGQKRMAATRKNIDVGMAQTESTK